MRKINWDVLTTHARIISAVLAVAFGFVFIDAGWFASTIIIFVLILAGMLSHYWTDDDGIKTFWHQTVFTVLGMTARIMYEAMHYGFITTVQYLAHN